MVLLGFPTSNRHSHALLTPDARLSEHNLVFVVRSLDESGIELVLNFEVSRGIENSEHDEGEASRSKHFDSFFLSDDPFEVLGEFDELAQV